MKFICRQENLKTGLNLISHLTTKSKDNLPILKNILLQAKTGYLELVSTDLEIVLKTKVRAKIEKQGAITLPGQLFTNYINSLEPENISFELKDNTLFISNKKHKTKINGVPADDYPVLPQLTKTTQYQIKSNELKQGLEKILFAISPIENRIEISGGLMVFNEPQKGYLTLVGTDSYRLSEKKISLLKTTNNKPRKVIVPYKTLEEVNRMTNYDKQINIFVSENQIIFFNNTLEVISRIISANYPSYKEIIPEKVRTKISLSASEFLDILRSVSLFSEKDVNDVFLEIKKGKLLITSSSNIGESQAEINIDLVGENNKIRFNSKYLIDFLNSVKKDEIGIEVVDQNYPAIFRQKKDTDYLHLIMPVKA